MKSILGGLVLVLALSSVTEAREGLQPDDIIQLKDRSILVGRIIKLGATNLEFLVKGQSDSRRISLTDVHPYSLYKIKLDRIDKESGRARLDLGNFCMTVGLYSYAASEFQKAAGYDKRLAATALKRRNEARHEDARSKFEKAKKLRASRKYSEADHLLRMVKDRYPETPYAEEAVKEIGKIAQEINSDNAAKAAAIRAKVKKAAAAKVAAQEQQKQSMVDRTLVLVEEAQRAWAEGLGHEPRNLTRADRAWKAAEATLLAARRNTDSLLKSNDIMIIKQAREINMMINLWLVRTYYRLGRMRAVELSYPTALEWLNKALQVPHDEAMDRLINELLLTLSQVQMRKRASGAGF